MSVQIKIKYGDITRENVDVIVNAANESLMGGGGVDGAIHKAAGPDLITECMKVPVKEKRNGRDIRCEVGEVYMTQGYDLPASYIIHTVGPRCHLAKVGEEETNGLSKCWNNALDMASNNGLGSIAFPSISTGAFLFPIELAADIAVKAIKNHCEKGTALKEIIVVCFSESDRSAYMEAWQKIIGMEI